MENTRNYYYSIDLGTTNSVMAYANMTWRGIRPVVLDIDRKNAAGSRSRDKLLPSVVFYYKDNQGHMQPEVGDYAKSRYGTKYGYVCKSVKSLMGTSDCVELNTDIPDQTPAQVSSRILAHMLSSAKKRMFQEDISDVIITVPASFDWDQCQATLEAARLAGIQVDNTHDVLLYEPKAVIYDFLQMQENGEIPDGLINLSKPKNILVFDLGGGTLDVSVHRAGYNQKQILDIEDIAISRYSRIGGDDFDELLALEMLKRFETMNGIVVPVRRRDEVMCRLRRLAEKLKMDISNDYEQALSAGQCIGDDYYETVMEINLYDAYSYSDMFTKGDIDRIIAPMLGCDYEKAHVSKIDTLKASDMNNIIYPILDVLAKAGPDCVIDTVILNGGMTKFYGVKERIEKFFGFRALITADPDLAVARGGVYYHYCLHKYQIHRSQNLSDRDFSGKRAVFNTGTIMNDDVNIGLRGQYVSRLIQAGTRLPYNSGEITGRFFISSQNGGETDCIPLDLFLGRGQTKNLPNRRIARRMIRFSKSYPSGTPVSLNIDVDQMRMMTVEAWITGQPKQSAVIEIDTTGSPNIPLEKTGGRLNVSELLDLNAKGELNEIRMLYEQIKTSRKKENLYNRINERIEQIGRAKNPEDFFEPLMAMAQNCYQNELLLGYLYNIAQKLCGGFTSGQKNRLEKLCARHFSSEGSFVRQNVYVQRKALDLTAVLNPDFLESYKQWLNNRTVFGDIVYALYENALLFEMNDQKVLAFMKDCTVSRLSPRCVQALIRRFGVNGDRSHQHMLKNIVKSTADYVISEDCIHPKYYLLLLAQLCTAVMPNPLRDHKKLMRQVRQALDQFFENQPKDDFYDAVNDLWNGISLTEDRQLAIDPYL